MGHTKTNDVERVEAHVRSRVWGQVKGLELRVLERGILIRGRARTYYVKQLAQHAVLETSQLPLAGNQIEVS
jgi:hypothetical protein